MLSNVKNRNYVAKLEETRIKNNYIVVFLGTLTGLSYRFLKDDYINDKLFEDIFNQIYKDFNDNQTQSNI
ncbi:hypothetical protein BCR32DRAFT_282117 [Anaeromyces robustus]|uniref:Uncharacterized protein n=1 Tax=Anaeromyces robustus TaxID=1754192 RepID=A0A1Y1WYF4_9FUNG|nr:hypothetical protein BCR32DRAFT_282117 [Anaeromyces robustus]|eukprot:ORX78607.1 hypothetical protein BCR32DRAFT_282117 [Anaeromyces robustus]